jgi:hypothetical protein
VIVTEESVQTKIAAGDPTGMPAGASYAQNPERGKSKMDLIHIVIVLVVVGVILGLINRFIPMASSIKSILNGVVVICVVLWLLQVFGIIGSLNSIKVR